MVKADCRQFRGDKPCRYAFTCEGCTHFSPFGKKILIIKCRAQGDVLRTTPLLHGLKRKYPRSHISWLVDAESVPLLAGNPFIDRILPYDLENVLPLLVQKFDILISLDKEPGLTSVAVKTSALKKLGFGMNPHGNLVVFNKEAEYAYRLGLDDDLKFKANRKTYQEIIFEAVGLEYRGDEYVFSLEEAAGEKARRFLRRIKAPKGRPAVGLNTGAGTKFETKQWPAEHFLELIRLLKKNLKANIFLLGGPREIRMNNLLTERSAGAVFNTGTDNSLSEFAGYLSFMDLVVCSDTLAMHLAIALKKKVVALFGPTCPQEIDLYGRGAKLFAGAECAPCYKQTCEDGSCMKDISPREVFEAVKKNL